jgi:hypothetical protein
MNRLIGDLGSAKPTTMQIKLWDKTEHKIYECIQDIPLAEQPPQDKLPATQTVEAAVVDRKVLKLLESTRKQTAESVSSIELAEKVSAAVGGGNIVTISASPAASDKDVPAKATASVKVPNYRANGGTDSFKSHTVFVKDGYVYCGLLEKMAVEIDVYKAELARLNGDNVHFREG